MDNISVIVFGCCDDANRTVLLLPFVNVHDTGKCATDARQRRYTPLLRLRPIRMYDFLNSFIVMICFCCCWIQGGFVDRRMILLRILLAHSSAMRRFINVLYFSDSIEGQSQQQSEHNKYSKIGTSPLYLFAYCDKSCDVFFRVVIYYTIRLR